MANVEDTVNKEYIDKHEAYLLLKQKAETYMLPATKEAYEKAAILIDSLPTIEAQPVKHGKWEHGECSVCGASPLDHVSGDMYVEVDYYPNYCPSCGSQNVDLWVDDESVPNEDMRPDNEVM